METVIKNDTEINIEDWNESPNILMGKQMIDTETGDGFLAFTSYGHSKCGCKVIGNGTLQFPLEVKHCKNHNPLLLEALELARELLLDKTDLKESSMEIIQLNQALKNN